MPNAREVEGPYGEFSETYAEPAENHVPRVAAITRRKDAACHTILGGAAKAITLLDVRRQVEVLKRVRIFIDIGTPGHVFGCSFSIDKRSDEQARAVLMAAPTAHDRMKVCVVVDHDIDPHASRLSRPPEQSRQPRRVRIRGVILGKVNADREFPPTGGERGGAQWVGFGLPSNRRSTAGRGRFGPGQRRCAAWVRNDKGGRR